MKTHTLKFSPSSSNPVRRMKARRKGEYWHASHFVPRYPFKFDTPSHRTLGTIFGVLHHLACHAPSAIRKQWKQAYSQFEAAHFANRGNASMRFLNKHTCHSWM